MKPTRERVRLADLQLASEYHQGPQDAIVRALESSMEKEGIREDWLGDLIVSRRGDALYLLDGVQRAEALARCGVHEAWALIFDDLTLELEAAKFVQLNNSQRRQALTSERSPGGLVALGYITAVLLPVVGFVLGIVVVTRPDEATSSHGVPIIVVSLLVPVAVVLALVSAS